MTKPLNLKSMTFSTERLHVKAVTHDQDHSMDELLLKIASILSEGVVESLPPYFHGIKNTRQAEIWLYKMQAESCFYGVYERSSSELIGFLFLHESEDNTAHLGYLLSEQSWGVGFASELLLGLVRELKSNQLLCTLIAGVDESNVASIRVLRKAQFTEQSRGENGVLFFQCAL